MSPRTRSLAIIGILAVVLIGGGAVYKFVIVPGQNAPPSAAELQSWQYQVDKITTNLQGPNMIQAQFTLQAPNANVAAELSNRAAEVDDAIISVLHNVSADELSQAGGNTFLKGLIAKRINSFMTSGKIVDVYINSLIVQ